MKTPSPPQTSLRNPAQVGMAAWWAPAGENHWDICLFHCLPHALLLHALGGLRGLPNISPLLHGALQRLCLLLVHLHVINLLVRGNRRGGGLWGGETWPPPGHSSAPCSSLSLLPTAGPRVLQVHWHPPCFLADSIRCSCADSTLFWH